MDSNKEIQPIPTKEQVKQSPKPSLRRTINKINREVISPILLATTFLTGCVSEASNEAPPAFEYQTPEPIYGPTSIPRPTETPDPVNLEVDALPGVKFSQFNIKATDPAEVDRLKDGFGFVLTNPLFDKFIKELDQPDGSITAVVYPKGTSRGAEVSSFDPNGLVMKFSPKNVTNAVFEQKFSANVRAKYDQSGGFEKYYERVMFIHETFHTLHKPFTEADIEKVKNLSDDNYLKKHMAKVEVGGFAMLIKDSNGTVISNLHSLEELSAYFATWVAVKDLEDPLYAQAAIDILEMVSKSSPEMMSTFNLLEQIHEVDSDFIYKLQELRSESTFECFTAALELINGYIQRGEIESLGTTEDQKNAIDSLTTFFLHGL